MKEVQHRLPAVVTNEAGHMADVMACGGIVAGPTDTVWGLACSAISPGAVQRLLRLKERPVGKPMLVLVGSREAFETVAGIPYPELFTDNRPTTIIVPNPVCQLAPGLVAEDGSLGIRLVESGPAGAMCRALGAPVVSTSANFAGQPTPAFFSEIDPEILRRADYVSTVGRERTGQRPQPSRIVKLTPEGDVITIRP